ncbi:hypothetical protein [Mesorhizobium sp. LjNodule214]|uniref:hypothetical protein n=1 Tax=Mesorhizobium sp. LjNodule214 TaxID=3342252 RepID=UPI003F4FFFBE
MQGHALTANERHELKAALAEQRPAFPQFLTGIDLVLADAVQHFPAVDDDAARIEAGCSLAGHCFPQCPEPRCRLYLRGIERAAGGQHGDGRFANVNGGRDRAWIACAGGMGAGKEWVRNGGGAELLMWR